MSSGELVVGAVEHDVPAVFHKVGAVWARFGICLVELMEPRVKWSEVRPELRVLLVRPAGPVGPMESVSWLYARLLSASLGHSPGSSFDCCAFVAGELG